jgi:hypothetical protein
MRNLYPLFGAFLFIEVLLLTRVNVSPGVNITTLILCFPLTYVAMKMCTEKPHVTPPKASVEKEKEGK